MCIVWEAVWTLLPKNLKGDFSCHWAFYYRVYAFWGRYIFNPSGIILNKHVSSPARHC